MNGSKKVFIFGAAGRVGLGLASALMRHSVDLAVADCVDQEQMSSLINRARVDNWLSQNNASSEVSVYGGVDVLDEDRIVALLGKENPDIVVNYAIPFTWDATKQLPNYKQISRAGLGAFAAVQVLAPSVIGRALAASDVNATYVVGNLPDISVPILHGLSKTEALVAPIAGAGNVGLIEAAIRHCVALEHQLDLTALTVSLVAHHVHWVAPREPGYENDAPFLLKVLHHNEDITERLGNLRALMNRAIVSCYEPGAGFSSTTALLASRLVLGLLDETGKPHAQHLPAANGLPGGYPVVVQNGAVRLNLPAAWDETEAVDLMKKAHQRDGIDHIGEDGTIHFLGESVAILKKEINIDLPPIVAPHELKAVGKAQIQMAQKAIEAMAK